MAHRALLMWSEWGLFIVAAAAACVGTCSFFVYTYLHFLSFSAYMLTARSRFHRYMAERAGNAHSSTSYTCFQITYPTDLPLPGSHHPTSSIETFITRNQPPLKVTRFSPKRSPQHNSLGKLPLDPIHPLKFRIPQPPLIQPHPPVWINRPLHHPRLPLEKVDKISKTNPSLVPQGEVTPRSRRILIPNPEADLPLRRLSEEHFPREWEAGA